MDCLIQARYSSSRLKGKVLKKINNFEVLEHVIYNLKKSNLITNFYILTSHHDSEIQLFCQKKKYNFFKGPLNNTFLRFNKFLKKNPRIKNFIRISGDSPLIDSNIVDKMILISKRKKKYDLISNIFPRTFPKGQSIEIIKTKTFLKIKNTELNSNEKEHVTKYFYNNKNKFKIFNYLNSHDMSKYNLSIDTNRDFRIIKKIITLNKNYRLDKLVRLLKKNGK